jgi:tRNA pseudouridine55 synthase
MSLTPGSVLIDKPTGITSFRALAAVKRACGTKKVGHVGTLDPFASGLLIALVGPATRCARLFADLPKTYRARFRFGSRTDTDDVEGRCIERAEIPSAASVIAATSTFTGTFDQLPPDFSAVHVDGVRAHRIAREGGVPAVRSRTVTVHRFEVESATGEYLSAEIECSSGTYIRAIARDLGSSVGSAAHVVELRRTAIGPFAVSEALGPGDVAPTSVLGLSDTLRRLPGTRIVSVPPSVVSVIRNGGRLRSADLPDHDTHAGASEEIVLSFADEVLAVGRWDSDCFAYSFVIPGASGG